MTAKTPILAWHYVSIAADGKPRLKYGDDRAVIVGKRLAAKGELELCSNGLHACINPLDCFDYLPGGAMMLCRVELSGKIVEGSDKLCARYRTVKAMIPALPFLIDFAAWCAEQAIQTVQAQGIAVDQRSIEAVNMVRMWLQGNASKEDVNAAAYAAGAAADAARAAAYAARAAYAADAARAAADAAADAAYAAYAARAAAYAAADAAAAAADAAYAARAAAYAAGAARAAAYAAGAAAYAAREQQRIKFEELFNQYAQNASAEKVEA